MEGACGPLLYAFNQQGQPMLDDKAGWRVEMLYPVQGARPVWSRTVSLIDGLRAVSALSGQQICANEVNDEVLTGPGSRSSVRPMGYGRAALVNLSRNAPVLQWDWDRDMICDLKGCGVADGCDPRPAHHANGLLTLAEAVHEVLIEAFVTHLIQRFALPLDTIRCLGVVDLGFAGACPPEYGFAAPQRAALLLREKARRSFHQLFASDEAALLGAAISLELHMRLIGLTSTKRAFAFHILRGDGEALRVRRVRTPIDIPPADPVHAAMVDLMGAADEVHAVYPNIQVAHKPDQPDRPSVVDFGHIHFSSRLEDPMVLRLRDLPHEWGPVLRPGDAHWIAPTSARDHLREALALDPAASRACHDRHGLTDDARERIGWFDTLCLSLAADLTVSADPQGCLDAERARQSAALEAVLDTVPEVA